MENRRPRNSAVISHDNRDLVSQIEHFGYPLNIIISAYPVYPPLIYYVVLTTCDHINTLVVLLWYYDTSELTPLGL